MHSLTLTHMWADVLDTENREKMENAGVHVGRLFWEDKVCMYIYVYGSNAYTNKKHMYTYTHISFYTHTYYVCVYMYTHIYMHVHTYG